MVLWGVGAGGRRVQFHVIYLCKTYVTPASRESRPLPHAKGNFASRIFKLGGNSSPQVAQERRCDAPAELGAGGSVHCRGGPPEPHPCLGDPVQQEQGRRPGRSGSLVFSGPRRAAHSHGQAPVGPGEAASGSLCSPAALWGGSGGPPGALAGGGLTSSFPPGRPASPAGSPGSDRLSCCAQGWGISEEPVCLTVEVPLAPARPSSSLLGAALRSRGQAEACPTRMNSHEEQGWAARFVVRCSRLTEPEADRESNNAHKQPTCFGASSAAAALAAEPARLGRPHPVATALPLASWLLSPMPRPVARQLPSVCRLPRTHHAVRQ